MYVSSSYYYDLKLELLVELQMTQVYKTRDKFEKEDMDLFFIAPISVGTLIALGWIYFACSNCKICPLYNFFRQRFRRQRVDQMREWQEDVRAAGMDPSQMHQYGHKHGQAPIFFTNQPPVPFHQGQTAYPGQPFQGPPGYSGQPFPQGQTSVHSNNLPSATM